MPGRRRRQSVPTWSEVQQSVRDQTSGANVDEFFPPPDGGGGGNGSGGGGGRLSDRVYHVILAGYGPVWARPYEVYERYCEQYVAAMQGFLRGGDTSRRHKRTINYYIDKLQSLSDMDARFFGELDDRRRRVVVVEDAEFVTDLNDIEDYGRMDPTLTGDGWKTE